MNMLDLKPEHLGRTVRATNVDAKHYPAVEGTLTKLTLVWKTNERASFVAEAVVDRHSTLDYTDTLEVL